MADVENVLNDLLNEQLAQKEKQNQLKTQLNEIAVLERKSQDNFYQLKKSIEVSEIQLKNLFEELEKTKNASSTYGDNVLELEVQQANLADKLNFKTKDLDEAKAFEQKLTEQIETAAQKITVFQHSFLN